MALGITGSVERVNAIINQIPAYGNEFPTEDQDGELYFSHEGVAVFSEIPPGWPEETTVLAPMIDELLIQ